jgi:hypothetical protein
MLLVVLGAGASHDSVDLRKHGALDTTNQPPLADQLFDPRFAPFARLFPQLSGIVDRLRDLPDGRTLEAVLEALEDEAAEYPNRFAQLTAVKFYLQHVLMSCGNGWNAAAHGATNYAALFDRIDAWRHKTSESVAIVTFNYDLMVEHSLSGLFGTQFNQIDDWVAGPHFFLFKLHGSVNWIHPVALPNHPDPPTVREIIEAGRDDLLVSQHLRRIDNPGDLDSPGDVYPALAIPLLTKNAFECPANHLEHLEQQLSDVNRVLVVGWRGTETSFLDLWRERIDADGVRRFLFVAETDDAARTTTGNISNAGIRLVNVQEIGGGFSNLFADSTVEDFLRA